jgi:peptide/nickel transport system permease protein
LSVAAAPRAGGTGWRAWLTTDTPGSRLQARSVQAYLAWLGFARNPLAMLGLAIIVALILMAAFAPLIATHPPNVQNLRERLLPPGSEGHLLGADELGRDIWSRIVYGARTTLTIVAP